MAVFHFNADISLILGDLCDLVNGEMFFKDFCVPSYCEYAVVSREAVDQGAEVQGKEEYCSQDKEHHHYPEDGSFGAVHEQLQAHREEQQSSEEAENVFLCLVSNHKLIHRRIGLLQC